MFSVIEYLFTKTSISIVSENTFEDSNLMDEV